MGKSIFVDILHDSEYLLKTIIKFFGSLYKFIFCSEIQLHLQWSQKYKLSESSWISLLKYFSNSWYKFKLSFTFKFMDIKSSKTFLTFFFNF